MVFRNSATAGSIREKVEKYNGRIGICHDWERYDESSEGFKHFYSMNDTNSFEDCDISKGEYYDIMSGMVEKLDIDWYQLEEIWEKSTERICWN